MARMTGRNLEILEEIRRRLTQEVQDDHARRHNASAGLIGAQWEALQEISEAILEACKKRDIEKVAVSTRKMKQRLRKRAIRKALSALESEDKPPEGECKCSKCGAVLDGSEGPCLDDVLCTKCALKKDPNSDKAKDQEGEKDDKGKSDKSDSDTDEPDEKRDEKNGEEERMKKNQPKSADDTDRDDDEEDDDDGENKPPKKKKKNGAALRRRGY